MSKLLFQRVRAFRLKAIIFTALFVFSSCGDAERDDFPRRNFTGFFDLRFSEYSQNVFTAFRDMDGNMVGVNGIVVYNSGGTYFAFDLMCPHEKSSGCSVTVDVENDPSIAVCECCGSRFLLASPLGEVIEGPAKQNLHVYDAEVNVNNILVVFSGY
ncbi:Rieske (2Fe-2S) protein [Marinilabilia sp.]|uniref:Rieske (2Fe-2S) protein n=1 Tax=Marinilabilia sp. TaxID=2021252 RepID=UPI0025C24CDD|nr:Rieske (2Fe-2S) protein [Marinilabilia sp.]